MSGLMVPDANVVANGYVTPREEYFEGHASYFESHASPSAFASAHEKRAFANRQQHPNAESLARMISNARKPTFGGKVSIKDRICCYQWTFFTMNMVGLLV